MGVGGGIANEINILCSVGWLAGKFASGALLSKSGEETISQLPCLSGGSGASGPYLNPNPLDLFLTSLLEGVFLDEEEWISSQLRFLEGVWQLLRSSPGKEGQESRW